MSLPRRAVLSMSCCVLFATAAHAASKPPTYNTAPSQPVCSSGADLSEPMLCSWSGAGLSPTPIKYAAQVLVGYDPGCDGTLELSGPFSFTTPDAQPVLELPIAALDKTVCLSNDSPCTNSATYHPASVQVRVKALNPPTKKNGGSQSNPYSAYSVAETVEGACGVPCPAACAAPMDEWLSNYEPYPSGQGSTQCGYDASRHAGYASVNFITALTGYCDENGNCFPNYFVVQADIRDNSCYASEIGVTGLTNAEQAACASAYAAQFAAEVNQACNVSPP
jgi:hypothetical protein